MCAQSAQQGEWRRRFPSGALVFLGCSSRRISRSSFTLPAILSTLKSSKLPVPLFLPCELHKSDRLCLLASAFLLYSWWDDLLKTCTQIVPQQTTLPCWPQCHQLMAQLNSLALKIFLGLGVAYLLKNIFLSSLMKSSTCLGSFCYFELTSLNWVSASCLYEGLRTLTSPRQSSRWNGAISWRGSEACMRSWVAVAITVISPSRRSLRAISFLMLSLSSAKGGFSFHWNPIRFVSSPILCAFLIC